MSGKKRPLPLPLFTGCASTGKSYFTQAVREMLIGEWKDTGFDLSKRPARGIIAGSGNLTVYDNTHHESGERMEKITGARDRTETGPWLRDGVLFDDSDTVCCELCTLDLEKMGWSILRSEDDYPEEWDAATYPSYFYRRWAAGRIRSAQAGAKSRLLTGGF